MYSKFLPRVLHLFLRSISSIILAVNGTKVCVVHVWLGIILCPLPFPFAYILLSAPAPLSSTHPRIHVITLCPICYSNWVHSGKLRHLLCAMNFLY